MNASANHSILCVPVFLYFSFPGGSWDWEYLGFASPEVRSTNPPHTIHEHTNCYVPLTLCLVLS